MFEYVIGSFILGILYMFTFGEPPNELWDIEPNPYMQEEIQEVQEPDPDSDESDWGWFDIDECEVIECED